MTPPLLTSTARVLAAGAATASLVALAACTTPSAPPPAPAATSDAPSSEPPSTEPSPQPTATVTVTPTPEPSPTPTQSPTSSPADTNAAMLAAGSIARRAVDGSTVISIEAERSGWEVEVVTSNGNEQQVRTNPAGTEITSGPTTLRTDADDRAENRRLRNADVSYREAARIVLREVSGGLLRELNLDEDDGNLRWEADVRDGNQQRTVEIDADSGRVISNDLDD